jgi:hypothetical protein
MHTDAYAAYDRVGGPKMVHAACWAHARRNFDEALQLNKQDVISTQIFSADGEAVCHRCTTPRSSHRLQVRFSRLVTNTKYFAGSTSSCSLSSYPITVVACPQPPHTHRSRSQATIFSTRGRCAGRLWRPGCLWPGFGSACSSGASGGDDEGARSLSAWTSGADALRVPESSTPQIAADAPSMRVLASVAR